MPLETMEVFEAVRQTVYTKEAVDELFRRIRERIAELEERVKALESKKG
jgi:BMFP domain-containing protein YqiC